MRRLMLTALVLAAATPAAGAAAKVRTVCGERSGTAGNAFIGELMLARQGDSSRLLDDADRLVGAQPHGETGTQNGRRYCVTVRLGRRGEPVRVLAARSAGAKRR